jgi:hypothetical protein
MSNVLSFADALGATQSKGVVSGEFVSIDKQNALEMGGCDGACVSGGCRAAI